MLQGWVELIDVLVSELGNQVDARDNYQFTPLHSGGCGGWSEQGKRRQKLVKWQQPFGSTL